MSKYTHEIKREENAKIMLTIHVPKDIVMETYNSSVKEIAKKAEVKGFRKGKVPINILEQKFGDSLRAEATEKIIQAAVKAVLEDVEEKPLYYSQPKLEETAHDNPLDSLINPNREYSFTISYDTEPKIELGGISNLELTNYIINISEEDIAQELSRLQERNAIKTDKNDPIVEGDEVIFSVVTLDNEGNEIADTQRSDINTTIGADGFSHEFDNDLLGMKSGDEKIVHKNLTSSSENNNEDNQEEQTTSIKIKVSRVRESELPSLDDEFAQDVRDDCNTMDELKVHLKKDLEDRAQRLVFDIHKKEMINYLVANSKYEIPESDIDMHVMYSWRQFVQKNGGDEKAIIKLLEKSGTPQDKIMEMWRPGAKSVVAEEYIVNELIKKEGSELNDAEIEEYLKKTYEKMGSDYQTILNYYKDNDQMPQLKRQIQEEKVFAHSIPTVKKIGEKQMTFSELVAYIQEEEQARHAHSHDEEHNHE